MADRISYEVDFSAKGAQALWNEFLAGSESAGRALNQALGGKVKKELFVEVKADDSGVKRIAAGEREVYTELQKIINLQEKANKTQQGSVTSLRQQVNEAKQARDGMVKYGTSADGVFVKVNQINGAWAAQNQRVKDLQRQLDIAGASNVWQKLAAEYNLKGLAGAGRQITDLVNIFQSVSIIVGQVIGSVNQLFDALQKIQSIQLTFAGIGAGGDISKVFSESSRIALGLGVNLNTVRDSFQQLSPVILATGGNIGDVSAVAESLSSRFVTFGLSADKSRRVMNGVVQAFSKGKLMAEELTQQISEADPAFRTDLATAIGVSVKQLGEMVKAGQITNDVLLEAIPRMSKASGLFGKLGNSALDAARGFREGGVTVEQFRNQIGTIEQLSLENLVNPDTGALQPLLASLVELRAVITDVVTAFAGSEIFETFLDVLGAVASQVSLVVQAIVKLASIIASVTQPIFGAINAIDSLGGLLKGFGVISSAVAAIITAKLLVAISGLAASGTVGAAVAGINLLTQVINTLRSGSILNLIKSLGSSILAFVGLKGATKASAAAETKATATTAARTVASKLLTGQLIAQAAAEKLLGVSGGGGKVPVTQGRGGGGIPSYLPALEPLAGAAGEAAKKTDKLKDSVKGLGQALKGIPANPYIAIGAGVLAGLTAGFVVYARATRDAAIISSNFSEELRKIQANAEVTKRVIDSNGSGIDEYAARLDRLAAVADRVATKEGGSFFADLIPTNAFGDVFKDINVDSILEAARKIGSEVKVEVGKAKTAVNEYDKANDKSGNGAKRVAADIVAGESTIQAALDATKGKRNELIAEAEKNPKQNKKEYIEKLKLIDGEIKKLEQQKKVIAAVRGEAKRKGILLPIEFDIKDAESILGTLGEKIKGLKAQIIVEADPAKREELQGELNGLEAQLKYLQEDPVKIAIEAKFKIDQRALQDGLSISQAVLNNLQASADYTQSLFGLQAGYISGQERTRQKELETLNERLDGEKDIRAQRIEAAEEAGASEAYIKALKKEDRDADRAGLNERKQKEAELKALAEQKRQVEIQALQAKLNALPAQQAAERESLRIQQTLAKLELERLTNAAQRAKLEGLGRLNQIEKEIKDAEKAGDQGRADELNLLYNKQVEYLRLLKAEEESLIKSGESQEQLNGLQASALGNKQAAQTLDIQAQLAAQNALSTQTQTTAAVQATAGAMSNAKQNAEAFRSLSAAAAEYQKTGAAEARRQADAKQDAADAANAEAAANRDAADATSDATGELDNAAGATNTAAGAAGDLSENLGQGADEAKSIYDTLTALDGTTINVNVQYTGTPGLWTGGPTVGGQTYRINELGKEGFLSSTGTLSPINKPRNALWKAPGKGMVIPAHIMSRLDVPTGRVSTGVRPSIAGSGRNGLSKIAHAIQVALSRANAPAKPAATRSEDAELVKIAREIRTTLTQSNTNKQSNAADSGTDSLASIARDIRTTLTQINTSRGSDTAGSSNDSLVSIARDIQSTLSQPSNSDSALQEMAGVQAHQAMQIGKLSRAVTKLAEKDWNVNVGVRNTGSTAYLDALNRRM